MSTTADALFCPSQTYFTWTQMISNRNFPNNLPFPREFILQSVQRPFINDFSSFPDTLWTNWHRKNTKPLATKVEVGKPIAQDYSFGAQWLTSVKHNLTYIVGPDSPVHQVTTEEAVNLYSAGPPYWFTAKDGFLIAQHWAGMCRMLISLQTSFYYYYA